MAEFLLKFDLSKISPEKTGLIINELELIATVENNIVFYDETNQEQCQKLKEIFDKHLLIS
jgi:hypothetical protein